MSARILIVEDTPNNLQLMRYLLEAGGHVVLSVDNAEDALEIARVEHPDLIVMDVQLGGMNGDEALESIRADSTLNSMTVVAVTAFAMVGTKEQMLEAGFNGYLTKPIEPRTFLSDIEQFLPESLRGPGLQGSSSVASRPMEIDVRTPNDGPLILAVDDRPTNITLLRSVFESHGYRIVGASNIQDAISFAERTTPDAVLSDVHIGRESGIDLLAHLRESVGLSEIPFAFLTATEERVESIEDEWNALVIRRPIEPLKLLAEVQELLGEGKRRRS